MRVPVGRDCYITPILQRIASLASTQARAGRCCAPPRRQANVRYRSQRRVRSYHRPYRTRTVLRDVPRTGIQCSCAQNDSNLTPPRYDSPTGSTQIKLFQASARKAYYHFRLLFWRKEYHVASHRKVSGTLLVTHHY